VLVPPVAFTFRSHGMAKKKKKLTKTQNCDIPNCLVHKFWPAIAPALGEDAIYHIDQADGELIIRTGLRVIPDGEVVQTPWFYPRKMFRCPTCGRKAKVRNDCINRGLITQCPFCSSIKSLTELS